ncbi:putative bifunctional methylthioribulose-1-phosphate dehydratase enolase-phosphatase E1 [Micractinium conductrix]|uniref:Probable methylthioribulose-1-phosphate dehydratase n=1 Tax=Micractinium conductrix TaxID=554055 RepID=A0A2P6VGW7_9CHLO|nr:putative bifunctional methylthioribulose-1-phosphate dehydratase enolase-phosphatase E1 [Micractinium conductrix]|eukprot:PSC73334.1 putative bifunctional methylthioribulose-1-phosphate dehydratase enolase-phosphatase E1 [Micractinium conductrix]
MVAEEYAEVEEAKQLVAELCANLYTQGHVSGTGGGISIKVPTPGGDRIVMAPSGVQKERMRAEDMFVLDTAGAVVHTPEARPAPYKPPKLSECAPLFMSAFELRGAGAVLHGHSMNAFLATLLHPEAPELRVTHCEMIKGIAGQGFYSVHCIPIIENTARECELTDRLREAIAAYPQANAVLVRRHGVYVWGKNWIEAKTQFECYEYLFEAAVRMHQMGLDAGRPPAPPAVAANGHATADAGERAAKKARLAGGVTLPAGSRLPTAVVLDIEGTIASISYVTDVLFPYARERLRSHLQATYDSADTQEDLALLRQQAESDAASGLTVPGIPGSEAGQEAVVAAAVANCEAQMAGDRKTTALKSLQGHIWAGGFARGELRGELFADVPDALAQWRAAGMKTYIYSSGSRGAQRDLLGRTTVGDLRPYLAGFFDTTSGPKVEATSYRNIALSLGADSPADLLFATDNPAEARAAAEAGWQVVLADRPGNAPLPQGHGFPVATSAQHFLAAFR